VRSAAQGRCAVRAALQQALRTWRQQAHRHDAACLLLGEAHSTSRHQRSVRGAARASGGDCTGKTQANSVAPRSRDAMALPVAGSVTLSAVRVRRARAASRVTAASGAPARQSAAAAAVAATVLAAAGPAAAAGGNAVAQLADLSSLGLTIGAGGAIAGLAFVLMNTDPSKRCAAHAQRAAQPRVPAQRAARRGRVPGRAAAALTHPVHRSDSQARADGAGGWRQRDGVGEELLRHRWL
jgi:hypothetical protein